MHNWQSWIQQLFKHPYMGTEPESTEQYAQYARRTNPTDYSFSSYCLTRGNLSTGFTYYLMWAITANETEDRPGPLDYVSIEWNTNYATYNTSYGDGEYSSINSRSTGIVLFNLEDDELVDGASSHGTVRVDPIANRTMEFGSKFVHTYHTTSVTGGSATSTFDIGVDLLEQGLLSLGLSHTMGFEVTVGTNVEQWQSWAESSIDLVCG